MCRLRSPSFPAARELGRNMLKALVRTAQAAEKP
jgi:hypothetical protein